MNEAGICSRVYPSQTDALYALLREVCPPWHVKLWKGIKEGWHAFKAKANKPCKHRGWPG